MARKIFALGIFAMASACGVLGYQALTYYFYGYWPAVPSYYVFGKLFGGLPVVGWHWVNDLLALIGTVPVAVVGFVISYILLLVSDFLRGEARRPSS